MSTLGQPPSRQDAKVQNQHNEPQEQRRDFLQSVDGETRWTIARRGRKALALRSTEVLGMWPPQISVPRCLSDRFRMPNWEFHPHGWCRGDPHLPQRHFPVYLGDMFEEVCLLSRLACFERKSVVFDRAPLIST